VSSCAYAPTPLIINQEQSCGLAVASMPASTIDGGDGSDNEWDIDELLAGGGEARHSPAVIFAGLQLLPMLRSSTTVDIEEVVKLSLQMVPCSESDQVHEST
jgi:hypothetical protein